MISTFAVANFFIEKSKREKVELSPMKLQKLVYFAHGWYLAMYKKPLIDETIEAWQFGPVIPSLYDAFKHYGNKQITKLYENFWGETPMVKDKEMVDFLETIWDLYAEFSAIQLSNATHEEGSPWYITIQEYIDEQRAMPRNKDIDDKVIADFFSKRLNPVGAE